MKKIFLSVAVIFYGVLFFYLPVLAETNISVVPASMENKAGQQFDVSVKLDPAGQQVCVVKGSLNFSNLSCQNISIAKGLLAQITPTCANPSFTLGIPKCSPSAQTILSASVKGPQAGDSSLSLAGLKIIGAGSDVTFTSQNGKYSTTTPAPVTANPKPIVQQPNPEPEIIPEETQEQATEPTDNIAIVVQNQEQATASLFSAIKNIITSPIAIISFLVALLLILWFTQSKFLSRKKITPGS